MPFWITLLFLALIVCVIVKNIQIVPQAHACVVERLGTYHCTWQNGLHVKIPLIDRIAKRISLKEEIIDFEPQPVITKDNVTMQIDSVLYYTIVNPNLYTYGVEEPLAAIENLTATTLRNIIGDLTLDNTLTSRDKINIEIKSVLDEVTENWGIVVNRVELKNIVPPEDIRKSMESQMIAERQKRAKILQAEGEKESVIRVAEGEKESAILRAEAKKESMIRGAQGEAEAIKLVQQAKADTIKLLNESAPTQPVLTLKSLEAFAKAADGQATKIIIPSNIQGLAGLATSVAELVKTDSAPTQSAAQKAKRKTAE